MATDRNLLFGAFALITGFIDPDRFSETCKLLSAQPDESVESVLRGRGWISADDEQHLGYLVQSYLHNHHENAGESLSGLPSDIRQSLAALENLHFRGTIASLDPGPGPAATGGAIAAPASGPEFLSSLVKSIQVKCKIFRTK